MRLFSTLLVISICLFGLSACASKFPTPTTAPYKSKLSEQNPDLNGSEIFALTFVKHGGNSLNELRNLNVGLTGEWKQLIRRIQPLVTDFTYRVDSQERLLPRERVYAAQYQGPAGTKGVFRSADSVAVHYNDKPSNDAAVLSSTALTADSFHLFLLGPLALKPWQDNITRISDQYFNGINHWRIHINRIPGLGFSERDDVVLWVNPDSKLTARVQITLEGHDTTKGAHVEVDYLNYIKLENYIFPSDFFERVNAPISIDAHAWRLTGIDINRDYQLNDINDGFKNDAKRVADKSNLQRMY